MSLSESENICFTLRSFLVICITPYSNIVFPVQGTFIAILPVHPVPGKENILPIYNLRTKSIHYLFQWKNYIYYVHPKAVDSQPFQTSIKSHCHWKKRLQNISLFLSRASIHRQALNEISSKRICQSALGKGTFPHKLELRLFPAVSLAARHPTFWLLPITTCLTRQSVLGIQRGPTHPAWAPHAAFLQKLPI